jgi:hypothetical protein
MGGLAALELRQLELRKLGLRELGLRELGLWELSWAARRFFPFSKQASFHLRIRFQQ